MRCYCCDRVLSTQESVRRFKKSKMFTDMCGSCLSTISDEVETIDSQNLEEDDGHLEEDEYE